MLSFPAGRNDDQVDMLGLLGQLLDTMISGRAPKKIGPPAIRDRSNKRFGEDDSKVINWKLI